MGNKIKAISILFALILLTFCVVFLPQLISDQNDSFFLNKRTYWNYTARSNTEISSEQVIRLYQNQEFNFNFIYFADESCDKTIVAESSAQLFETVFESNSFLCEYMNKMLTDGVFVCFQNNVLTVVDNRPVAFHLVRVIVETPNENLEFIYEEKTKTLLTFSYYFSSSFENYKTGIESFVNDLDSALTTYCENKLGLRAGEYYIEYTNEDQNYGDIVFCILIQEGESDKI